MMSTATAAPRTQIFVAIGLCQLAFTLVLFFISLSSSIFWSFLVMGGAQNVIMYMLDESLKQKSNELNKKKKNLMLILFSIQLLFLFLCLVEKKLPSVLLLLMCVEISLLSLLYRNSFYTML